MRNKNFRIAVLSSAMLVLSIIEMRAQTEVRCEIRANLMDRDPKGANVRNGAGNTFSIIGNLPAERTDGVTIVAGKGSWVKISSAEDEDGEMIFNKEGWVFSSLLGVTVSWNPDDKLKKGSHLLYAEPNKKGRVLGRLPSESPVRLVGCDGKWAKIRFGPKIGWIAPEAQCTSTRTNCS